MPALASELHNQLRETLLKCSQFDSDGSLRAVFASSELRPFRDRLREANSRSERVDACLDLLPEQQLSDGHSVMVLFLEALRDRYRPGDALRDELQALCEAVPTGSAPQEVPPASAAAMDDDQIASLRRQLEEARANLRLIEERKSQYVLEVDVPLQLVKEERRLRERIAELEERIAAAEAVSEEP